MRVIRVVSRDYYTGRTIKLHRESVIAARIRTQPGLKHLPDSTKGEIAKLGGNGSRTMSAIQLAGELAALLEGVSAEYDAVCSIYNVIPTVVDGNDQDREYVSLAAMDVTTRR